MALRRKIRVVVVDDSVFFRKILTDSLSSFEQIEVVGTAINASDAREKIVNLRPDAITLDVEMPKVNGIEFLKMLLPEFPIPVVLVSALNISVFDALSAGAVDFVRKPDPHIPGSMENFVEDLGKKVIIASRAHVRPRSSSIAPSSPSTMRHSFSSSSKMDSVVIALGASTGGTEATLVVLKDLPPSTPGIVIVQHMPPGFTKMYAERLNRACQMEVKEAQSGDRIQRGRVLIAPGDEHMKIVRMGSNYTVNCFKGDKVNSHCPSVDVLFNSAANVVGSNAVGIIMTGMGRDGAAGLLNMRKKGAFTIGQDEASCVVYGMPMVAFDIGAVSVQAPCDGIAGILQRHLAKLV